MDQNVCAWCVVIPDWLVAVGGVAAGGWAAFTYRIAEKQRRVEHRWRQANLARQLMDQFYDNDPYAALGRELIDDEVTELSLPVDEEGSTESPAADDKGKKVRKVPVDAAVIRTAMEFRIEKESQKPQFDDSETSREIRRALYAVCYMMERFALFVDTDLIKIEDIEVPTGYYADRLFDHGRDTLIEPYLKEVGYIRAYKLIVDLRKRRAG